MYLLKKMVDSYDFISKYILINRIDQGGYGKVYKAYSRHLNTCVAVKIFKNKLSAKTEWKVITKLQGVKGIPLVYDFITGAHETLFTMQLLGSNLMRFTSIFQSYSYKPLNKIVLEGLKILKKLHKKHYVHNDIKPNQFLVSQDFKKVFLVDFGLSQKFSQKSVHRPMKEENSRAGNCIFSSINWHRWLTLSRRDDLVSFAYMIIYLAKGSLPWENVNYYLLYRL
jgi:casein kinase 1, delta